MTEDDSTPDRLDADGIACTLTEEEADRRRECATDELLPHIEAVEKRDGDEGDDERDDGKGDGGKGDDGKGDGGKEDDGKENDGRGNGDDEGDGGEGDGGAEPRVTLTFAGTDEAVEAMTEFVRLEHQCCSFARFDLEVTPGAEANRLTVSGEGADAMFEQGMKPLLAEYDPELLS